MALIPDAKEIAQQVQVAMKPMMSELTKLNELLTQVVELERLQLELYWRETDGPYQKTEFSNRIRAMVLNNERQSA